MATATAPKAPPVLATTATTAPVAAAPVTKESSLLTPPPAVTRKTGLPNDNLKTKPSPPVKDIPKSPVNGYANGHANGSGKPQSKPDTPRSPLTRHPSGGDHNLVHHHGHGCTCHRCIKGVNEVTHISEPYCPNPCLPNITKDYETKVRIIQRIPEMRKVEKTFFVKQLVHEDRTTTVKKSRIIMVDVEEWVQVPVIKEVPRRKTIKVHKIHEEIRNHTYEVPVIEYERHCTVKQIPRVCMVDVEEEITVPLIKEVPETVKVQLPTGEFCENPIEEYCTPGDFNLLCKDGRHHGDHHKHRSGSSSPSSSDSESDDEKSHSPKHGKGDGPKPINTKPVQDYGPKKPLSPINTKAVPADTKPSGGIKPKAQEPHDKPYPDPKPKPKPHDKPYSDPKPKPKPHDETTYPDTKPKPEPHDETIHPDTKPKPKPHDETTYPDIKPKPKPHEEAKPKPHEESKPKLHDEPKPMPHEETPYPDSKPKTHEERHDTKPKAPNTDSKPKVPTSNAPKRTNSVDSKPKAHEDDSSKKVDSPTKAED